MVILLVTKTIVTPQERLYHARILTILWTTHETSRVYDMSQDFLLISIRDKNNDDM